MSRHARSSLCNYFTEKKERKKEKEERDTYWKLKFSFYKERNRIPSRLTEFKETSRGATSCFQRVHRQNGERHSKWYELAFSESKTFPLRPFSFIDAIVSERCWLDSLFLLPFVVFSSSFSSFHLLFFFLVVEVIEACLTRGISRWQ